MSQPSLNLLRNKRAPPLSLSLWREASMTICWTHYITLLMGMYNLTYSCGTRYVNAGCYHCRGGKSGRSMGLGISSLPCSPLHRHPPTVLRSRGKLFGAGITSSLPFCTAPSTFKCCLHADQYIIISNRLLPLMHHQMYLENHKPAAQWC